MGIARSVLRVVLGLGALAVLALTPIAACAGKILSLDDGGPPVEPDAGSPAMKDARDVHEPDVHSGVQVTMNANDKAGSGSNTQETVLNVTNVNASDFGLLFTRSVDGDQYAQPLFMSDLVIADGKTHDVVFVATENDTVYAFDADDAAAAPLWQARVGAAATLPNPWFGPQACKGHAPDLRQTGITATPAIDPVTRTMYVVALDVDTTHMVAGATCIGQDSSAASYCKPYACSRPTIAYQLHALDITTGAEKPGSPVAVVASVPGTGAGSVGRLIQFDATVSLARVSLMIDYGNVYFATSSYGDTGDYHGWVFAYDEKTLAQKAVFVDTPNGIKGGIWMSGRPLLSDGAGHVFVVTGNGSFDLEGSGGDEYGDAVIRLDASALTPEDWFSPYWSDYDGQNFLEDFDDDLGSAGGTFIPNTSLLLASGKLGQGYVLDTASLGRWMPKGDRTVQEIRLTWRVDKKSCNDGVGGAIVNSAPIAWVGPDGTHVYVWAALDRLRDYVLTKNGLFTSKGICFCEPPWQVTLGPMAYEIYVPDPPCGVPSHMSRDYIMTQMGGAISLSSDGAKAGTGIVWASRPSQGDAYTMPVTGVLEAYDATDVSTPLWSSATNALRDGSGNWAKFVPPTIANGRVYLATQSNQLAVYGSLAK
jgi:hypothetical protein